MYFNKTKVILFLTVLIFSCSNEDDVEHFRENQQNDFQEIIDSRARCIGDARINVQNLDIDVKDFLNIEDYFNFSYELYPMEVYCACDQATIMAINESIANLYNFSSIFESSELDTKFFSYPDAFDKQISICTKTSLELHSSILEDLNSPELQNIISIPSIEIFTDFVNSCYSNPTTVNYCNLFSRIDSDIPEDDYFGNILNKSLIGFHQAYMIYMIDRLGIEDGTEPEVRGIMAHAVGGVTAP